MEIKTSNSELKCYIHENIREYRKEEIFVSVCNNLSADYLHNGNRYCILHLPDENKDKEIFVREIEKRKVHKNYDFRAVFFSAYAEFSDFTFDKIADFRSATFKKNVSFIGAVFKQEARFSWTNFQGDTFFDLAVFEKKALFDSCYFGKDSDVNFRGVAFNRTVDFSYATFSGFVEFGWKNKKYSREEDEKKNKPQQSKESCFTTFRTRLKLQHTRIESPNKIKFHSVRLRPHWFVNTEAAKFIFTNCRWKLSDESHTNIETELNGLRHLKLQHPHKLLTKVFWQLAENHEENKSYPKASRFRRFAQDSKLKEEYFGWKIWSWHWWYWLSSCYGESPFRAGMVLAALLFISAIAFTHTNFQVCPITKSIAEKSCEPPRGLELNEAILNSLATATFQNVEYIKPDSKTTTFIIILEKIFAPLQAALLALAIRRKFMR